MSVINWIQYTEPVVGANSPSFTDVVNRPLREILTASGLDPDADFPGFLVAGGGSGSFTTITVTGVSDLQGNVQMGANATVAGNLSVTGNFSVTGTAPFVLKSGDTMTGGLIITLGGLQVNAGGANVTGGMTVSGSFAVSPSLFTVDSGTGNTVVAGTLLSTGDFTVGASLFVVTAVSGSIAVNATKFTVAGNTGNTVVGGTFNSVGNFTVNTNKFAVDATTGDVTITGLLTIAGTLNVVGNFSVNTNKFTVNATSGNTAVAGTLGVTGAATFSNQITSTLGVITTDIRNFSGTATWNNGATTFKGFLLNVTNTASAAASNLFELQVGGVTRLAVSKLGALRMSPDDSGLSGGNTAYLYVDFWTGGGEFGGGMLIGNNSSTAVTMNTAIANTTGILNGGVGIYYYNGASWYQGLEVHNVSGGGATRSVLALMKGGGTVAIGASGTTNVTISGTLTAAGVMFSGALSVTNTTDSTSTTTGALIVSGGVGIAKAVFIGGNTTLSGILSVIGAPTTHTGTYTVAVATGLAAVNVSATLTAASGAARGVTIQPTVVAAANGDSLEMLRLGGVYTPGAFTGVLIRSFVTSSISSAAATSPGDVTNITVGSTNGTGAVNAYGIYVNAVSNATNNYAIITNGGKVHLTGSVTADALLRLSGTTTATAGSASAIWPSTTLAAAANNDSLRFHRITVNTTPGAFTGLTVHAIYVDSYSVAAFTSPGTPTFINLGTLTATGATNAIGINLGNVTGATNNYLIAAATVATFNVKNDGSATFAGGITTGAGAASDQQLQISAAAGQNRYIAFSSNLSIRWLVRADNSAETGSDAGSQFQVVARTDAGALIDTPLNIVRAAGGLFSIARPLSVSGAVTLTNTTDATTPSAAAVLLSGGMGVTKKIYTADSLFVYHTANLGTGVILQQTATGAPSPRLVFGNTTDWPGHGNAIYASSSDTLNFTTGATLGSTTGTVQWFYNTTGINPNTTNAYDLGSSSKKWKNVYVGTNIESAAYSVGGTAGASGTSTPGTGTVTVVNGIVTAIT